MPFLVFGAWYKTVVLYAGRVPAINKTEFHNLNQKMYIWINLKVNVFEFDHFGNI